MKNRVNKRVFAGLVLALGFAAFADDSARAGIIMTDTSHIRLAHHQTESGDDTSTDADVVNGAAGAMVSYAAQGNFSCCGPAYGASALNDGDIGSGHVSSGLYGIVDGGVNSLTLNFGATTTIGSIAIYDGYGNRDDATYTLKDGAGNILGSWQISDTTGDNNNGVDSYWLVLTAPIQTNELVIDTSGYQDCCGDQSYREIQVFAGIATSHDQGPGAVPEPNSLTLLVLGLAGLGFAYLRRDNRRHV